MSARYVTNTVCLLRVSDVRSDAHSLGGALQRWRDVGSCLSECQRRVTCLAADYNFITDQCYFHGIDALCRSLRRKPGCSHYRYVVCGQSVSQSVNKLQRMQNVIGL